MQHLVSDGQFSNISEIWMCGENVLRVYTRDYRCFKITAAYNVRGGPKKVFESFCEELIDINLHNNEVQVWVEKTDLPQARGDTIEACLTHMLYFLDELVNNKNSARA